MRAVLAAMGVAIAGLIAFLIPRRAVASVGGDASVPFASSSPTPLPATKAPAEPFSLTPRGIRNHNPGNIRTRGTANGIGGRDPWRGLIAEDADGYGVFATALDGLRAMAKDLTTGFRRDAEDTIREIITEWAPANENNTAAYIASVVQQTGYAADQQLTLSDRPVLIRAIVRHENGQQPYASDLIDQAVYLADHS